MVSSFSEPMRMPEIPPDSVYPVEREPERKTVSDRGYGFTPGGWKFIAVAMAFLNAWGNFNDAHTPFTWAVFGMSTLTATLLFWLGHRPSPRKLWRDKPGATAQVVEKEGP
jgi:hypothetical protein